MRSIMFVDNLRVKVRKLWEAVFGDEVKVDEPIKKIEGLPSATSEDAGKSVVVDSDGKWKLGEAGGGGLFVVRFIFDETEEEYICDKTFDEVKTEFEKGTAIVGADGLVVTSRIEYNDVDGYLDFYYLNAGVVLAEDTIDSLMVGLYRLNADNSVEYYDVVREFES